MAQYVLINTIGTRRAGEVIDTVQDPGVVPQLAAFGGVLVLLPSPTLQPYIEAAQLAYDRADADEAQDIMMAGYASTTAIAGGGTAGFVPIWTAGAVLGDSVIKQSGSLVGINVAAPTAALSLPSGVAGAASMNFGTGVAPGAPNSGDLWFDGTYLYLRAAGVNQPLNAPFGTGTPNVLTKWSSVSGLTDTAITEASGAIRTIGITNAGAGATNGTYSQQALTTVTGTGTGATADIVVAGNVVTVLSLRNPGTGYAAGDTLSCATIGGGGFVFTVSAVSASDNASGNVTALRVGAGTATPTAEVDVRGAIYSALPGAIVARNPFSAFSGAAGSTYWRLNLYAGCDQTASGAYALANTDALVSSVFANGIWDQSARTTGVNTYGAYVRSILYASAAGGTSGVIGLQSQPALYGAMSGKTIAAIGIGNTTSVGGDISGTNTITTLTGIQTSNAVFAAFAQNITTAINFFGGGSFSGAAHAITDFYGVRLAALSLTGGSTITNRWSGISHEDALGKSRFYGNVGVGNALDVGAGKVIGSLTLTNAGAGATNGTYSEAALTGGSGTGATADIVVAGNVVTVLTLRNPGQGYVVGDTLSTAAIGGAGFVFTVATTASILRSDGTVVGSRVGAGTTTPTSAMTVNGMVTLNGAELVSIVQGGTFSNFTVQTAMVLTNGAAPTALTSNALNYYTAYLNPLLDATALTNNYSVWGVASRPTLVTGVAGATTVSLIGGNFGGQVNAPTMTGKTVSVTGIALFPGVGLLGAGNTISSVTGANLSPGVSATNATPVTVFRETWTRSSFSGAAHTVTDYYAIKMDGPTLSGGATITNRWAIAQDDALAKSRFYGNLGVGNALDVGAGKVIASLTLTNAGAGATNGTYIEAALTGGTGTGATADIVVAGNVVTTLLLRNPGQGYTAGDTLSTAAIGGAGFVFTVASTASILRSDGTAVAARVGAGTTSPRLSLDAVNGAMITGSASMIETNYYTSYFNSNIGAFVGGTVTPSTIYRGVFVNPLINTTSMAFTTAAGLISNPNFTDSTAGSITNLTGLSSLMYRSYPNDLSTGANLTGVQSILGTRAGVGSVTSGSFTFFTGNLFHTVAGHTITTLTWYDTAATTLTGNATTTYLLRGRAFSGAGTITNRWAISQEDPLAKNQFLGNVGVGVDPGAGKMIASLTLTNGGAGYTNGTYSQVALTNITGTGTGATADIVVAGGIVTTVVLRAPGQGYVVGNTLSSASIGAGAGFVLTVATVASTIQADGEIIAPRIGAGTTTPRASMDVAAGGYLGTSNDLVIAQTRPGSSAFLTRSGITVQGRADVTSANEIATGLQVYTTHDVTAATTTPTFNAARFSSTAVNSLAGQTLAMTAVTASAIRGEATDLANAGTFLAGQLNAAVSSGVGATTTGTLWTLNCLLSNLAAGHTVTTGYGVRIQVGATGNFTTVAAIGHSAVTGSGTITTFYGLRLEASTAPTITNRYPISQEDTLGTNFVRAKTHFGAAVGTAAATTASIEVTAQGTLNGDIRLNSANAVVDVSAASTNGVKFNNRGGAGITGTTQFWYEEGTYTPTLSAGWTATAGNYAGYWTRNGRLVTLTIQFTGGTNSGAAGGSTISTPVGLTPARNGAGSAVNANGTALGNGVVVVTTAGTIINANAITTTTVDKTIVVQYEV